MALDANSARWTSAAIWQARLCSCGSDRDAQTEYAQDELLTLGFISAAVQFAASDSAQGRACLAIGL
jgi:hypothetical protein